MAVCLQSGHQSAGHAHTNQGSADDECRRGCRGGKNPRPEGSNTHQATLHEPGTECVQGDADGNGHEGKSKEIDRRQQTE